MIFSYVEFLGWLKEIDIVAKLNGYLGESYTEGTGYVYWIDKYRAGLTSIDAFEEDKLSIINVDGFV
jgi:hypothetical protein